MGVLLFLFGTTLAAGLYFVLADLLKIPRLATERALISAGRRERSLVKSLEALILGWALKLAPLIRMDEYKYRRLESKLTAAGLDMTPQVYMAYSFLKPCLILLGIIPCLLILPILSPLIVVLAVLTWFKESRRADELVKARMELIEGELPRFVATIHQELAASRDVLRILEEKVENGIPMAPPTEERGKADLFGQEAKEPEVPESHRPPSVYCSLTTLPTPLLSMILKDAALYSHPLSVFPHLCPQNLSAPGTLPAR